MRPTKQSKRIGWIMAALSVWVGGHRAVAQPAFQTVPLPRLPVGVDQSVFDQPVARFNPNLPAELVIHNRTGLPLEYGFTDPRQKVSELPPGETLRLGNLPIPNCMAINTPMLSPVGYRVSVDPLNVITVEVRRVNDVSGDHCLDLQKTGAIFVN